MAKLLILVSVLVSFVGLPSCKNKNSGLSLTITEDSFYIGQDSDLLLFRTHTSKDGKNYFSFYDSKIHSINIIELNTKVKIKSIEIPQSDSIKPNDLNDYLIHNFDSIFLQYSYQISIIDTSGKLKYNEVINKPFSDEWPEIIYNNKGSLFPMHFDTSSNELIVQQYSGKYFSWSKGYYDLPVEATYNFQKRTFKDVPIFYPEKYKKAYYGSVSNVYHAIAGDLDVFSFEGDENIYVYNKKNGLVSSHNCKSSSHRQNLQPLSTNFKDDINKKIDHYTISPIYLKILYDPYRRLFYRFFSNAVPLKNSNGTYNSNADKTLFLMVLNDKFKIIEEYEIDNNEWYWSFVSSKGLYLQRSIKSTINPSPTNDQKILFSIFDFSLK